MKYHILQDNTWNVGDVKGAIDELYNKASNMIPKPTQTKTITSNGTFDVLNYEKVNVNIPQGKLTWLETNVSYGSSTKTINTSYLKADYLVVVTTFSGQEEWALLKLPSSSSEVSYGGFASTGAAYNGTHRYHRGLKVRYNDYSSVYLDIDVGIAIYNPSGQSGVSDGMAPVNKIGALKLS